MIERKLTQLFDYQHFQQNNRLSGIIADVENRYTKALNDDDLLFVNAAGEASLPSRQPEGGDDEQ